MSWFLRGVQSAIFYYASCGPCHEASFRKRRRKEAKRERLEKEALAMQRPDAYLHPCPSEMNPYWQEEVALGPGPPPRRARGNNAGRNTSERRLVSAGTQSTVGSNAGSSLDVSPVDSSDAARLSRSWGSRRWQRADEELWDADEEEEKELGPRPHRHRSIGGSLIGLAGWTSHPRTESYYTARIPPVNDLHPPIVSTPSPYLAERKWMTEPPPSAKFMNGTDTSSNRSRSGSGTSTRKGGDLSLGRQVGQKALEGKLKKGEIPDGPSLSRGSSRRTAGGQASERDASIKSRPASAQGDKPRKRRPAPVRVSDPSSSDSDDTLSPTPIAAPHPTYDPTTTTTHPLRPRTPRAKPSTIASSRSPDAPSPRPFSPASSENSPPQPQPQPLPSRKDLTARSPTDSKPCTEQKRPPPVVTDSSLNVLQELVSPAALLGSRFAKAPAVEARIRLPPVDAVEELELTVQEGGGAWFSRGQRGEYVGVAGDGRARWSMDDSIFV